MKPRPKKPADAHWTESAAELRRHVESRLGSQQPAASGQRSEGDSQRLLHELQVHQIELELQNEEQRKLLVEAEAAAARYNDLYDFVPVGYFTLNAEGVITGANLAGANLLGCPRSRLLGRRFGAFVAKADLAAFQAFLRQTCAGETTPACDLARVSEGRPPRVMQLTAALALTGQECFVVATDVTERRRAEGQARQWQQMFRAGEFALAHTDPLTNTFVEVNPACARGLGYTCEEMVGKKVLDIYPPEIHAELRQRMQSVDQVGHLAFESIHLRKDGTCFPVQVDVTTIYDTGKRRIARVAYAQDITERKQAEARLQESETHYRLLAETGDDVVWQFDLRTQRFTYVSPAVEKFCGYTVADFLRQPMSELLTPDSYQMVQRRLPVRLAAFAAGDDSVRNETAEVWQVRRDRSSVPTEISTTLIADERRQVTHIQGVSRDITERKQTEERSHRLRDLGFVVAASSDLAAVLSLCLDTALLISGMDAGGVYLAEEPSGGLKLESHAGLSPDFVAAVSYFPADSENARWARKNQAYHGHANGHHANGQDHPVPTAEMREGLRAMSLIPVYHAGHLIGVLNVASHTLAEVPPAARDALETIASLVGGLIQRLRAKQALRESEGRLRSVLASMDDLVFVLNRDLVFEEFYQPLKAELFTPPQALVGKRFDDIGFPEPAMGIVKRATLSTVESGITSQAEYYLDLPQGRTWFDIHVTAFQGSGGLSAGVIWVVRNITPAKRVTASLEGSELRLSTALQGANMGVWDWDIETGKSSWSGNHEALWGYSPGEFPGTHEAFLARMHPEDIAGVELEGKRSIQDGSTFRHEYRVVWPDGSVHWVCSHGQPIFDDKGRAARMVGVVFDITDRKRAELSLSRLNAELEQRVRERTAEALELYHHAPCGYHSIGPDGVVLQMNDTELGWLGYSREEVVGHLRLADLMTPESAVLFEECSSSFKEQPGVGTREWNLRRKDGSAVTLLVNAEAVQDEAGRFLRSRSTVMNITERKHLETTLRESERRHRDLVNTVPDWVWEMDERGVYMFSGPQCQALLGYEPEEVLGRTALDFMPPDEAKRLAPLIGQLFARGEPIVGLVNTNRHKNGSLVVVETNGIPIWSVDGQFKGYRGLNHDVTERRRAEAQLRQLQSVVEQSPVVVFITDPQGVIEYVNSSFVSHTGYTAAEAVGRRPSLLKSGLTLPETYERLWQTVLAGETWRGELCNKRKDGSLFWELAVIAPLRDPAGQLTHFVAVKEDITERRRIAEELRQAKEAADSASRAKSVFLANMSHEIRTPMNAILGFAQLMRRDPGLSAQQRQRLDTINHGGEHLIRLISDILDMAKIESGQMQVVPEDCDFLALLADVEAIYRSRVEERRLRFEVQRAPGLPSHLHTDAGKVRQVLYNVLSNAVKFTVRGGIRVRVSAEPAPATAAGQPAARLCIEMTDTGPGIAAEETDRVFVAFEQTRSGRSLGGGTGLGLALSQRLARKLGGDLTFVSREGAGSTFQFTFVAAVKAPVSAGAAPGVPARRVIGLKGDGPPPTVLVVDDTESNRQLLHNLLELVGFNVLEAEDGVSAVARCRAERPGLVLMDRRMPGLDGLAATQAIRGTPEGRDTRILIVSADVMDTPEAEWRLAGANGFVSKPFRNEEILLQIGALLKVEYTYSEPPVAAAVQPALAPDAIGKFPARLRADLIQATETGNGARLRELIHSEVTPAQPALGQTLARLAAQYDYPTLLHALREKEL